MFAQKTETRQVSGFTGIQASGAFKITLNKSATESLVIEADEDLLPYVRSEVENGVLKLYLDNKKKTKTIITLNATIGVKELKKVKLSGACKLIAKDRFETAADFIIGLSGASRLDMSIKAKQLDLGVNGASSAELKVETKECSAGLSGASKLQLDLNASKAVFEVSGASKLQVGGSAERAKFETSGASNVKAADLAVEAAVVECSGVSAVEVNVSDRLEVECSGSSAVRYKGRPVLKIETSGSSKVKPLD